MKLILLTLNSFEVNKVKRRLFEVHTDSICSSLFDGLTHEHDDSLHQSYIHLTSKLFSRLIENKFQIYFKFFCTKWSMKVILTFKVGLLQQILNNLLQIILK
jgi:hypothetical protein